MSQRKVKRERRMIRRKAIVRMREYIDWCKENVSIRNEDGSERPVTAVEAAEFIYMTMHNELEVK